MPNERKTAVPCQNNVASPRPLWVEFPGEESTFSVDHEYMIGKCKHVKYVIILVSGMLSSIKFLNPTCQFE